MIVIMLMALIQGCGGGDDPVQKAMTKVDKSTPNGTFMSMLQAVKNNDINAMMQTAMSPEEYTKAVADFEEQKSSPSEADKAQYAQMMGMLTGDGAEDKLMGMVSPQLAQLRTQMPMYLMMGKGMIAPSIQSSPDIPEDQKESLTKLANAFVDYASNTDLLSEEITRKAISTAVSTAKSLDMATLDDVQNMSYDQAMGKASIVMGGVKDIMEVYGISIDDMIDSVKITDVVENGDSASMQLAYEFFGESFNQNVKMKKVNGQWITDQ